MTHVQKRLTPWRKLKTLEITSELACDNPLNDCCICSATTLTDCKKAILALDSGSYYDTMKQIGSSALTHEGATSLHDTFCQCSSTSYIATQIETARIYKRLLPDSRGSNIETARITALTFQTLLPLQSSMLLYRQTPSGRLFLHPRGQCHSASRHQKVSPQNHQGEH